MKTRSALAAAVLLLLPLVACDSGETYPLTFVCDPAGGPGCPAGDQCPVVPEGSGACGDLPGVLGHPPTPIDMARPVGCRAGLHYGNPAYGDSQVNCTCTDTALWSCPI